MKLLKFHFALSLMVFSLFQETRAQLIANFDMRDFGNQPIDSGCIPDMIIRFIDQSTNNGVPLTRYSTQNGDSFNSHNWDFDYQSNTSNVQSPVFGYFEPGTYNITLAVTQDGITFDSITRQVIVFVPPSVRMSVDDASGCDPHTVVFTNTSFSAGSNICETLIDFGDGFARRKSGAAARDTFMHTYELIPQQNCWTVTVIVTDCRGCDSTRQYTNMVCIDRPPVADFTPSPTSLCSRPFIVNFDNNSSSPASNLLAYRWDFGDGSPVSTQFEPSHTYTKDSTFTVTLTVVDTECLDTATTTRTVITRTVDANPVTSTPVVCAGPPAVAQFDATGSTGQIVSYTWNFGDGSTGTGATAQHSYAAAGNYRVRLTVTDDQGCSDTDTTVTVTVRSKPNADFTANPTTDCKAPTDVTFTINPNPPNVDYAWSFGDGDTSIAANPVHRYEQPGNYTVILEVTDRTTGCTNAIVKNSYINIQPRSVAFAMDVNRGCAPLTVNFINASDPLFTWFSWDFGEDPPVTSSLEDPQHTFNDTGTYVITFEAAVPPGPPDGCSGTITDTVRVGSPLIPDFSIDPNPACVNDPVNFTNLTDISGVQPPRDTNSIIWNWDFGGATSNSKNPPTQFYDEPTPDNDSLEVSLEVCYKGCCADTSLFLVILYPKAGFEIERSCSIPGMVIIKDLSERANHWRWYFGNGDSLRMPEQQAYQDSFTYVYTVSGNYTIKLVVKNDTTGCETEKEIPVEVSVLDADFDADKYFACVGEDVQFQNRSDGLVSENEWDFGDGTTTGLVAPVHSYSQPGTYTVRLIISDIYGCSDTMIRQNLITVSGATANFTSPDPSGCIPPTGNSNTITFNDLSAPDGNSTLTNWTWDFGDPPGLSYTQAQPSVSHTYLNPGVYTVSLTVRNSRGCEDTETKTAYVDVRKPVACFDLPYTQYCVNQPVYFQQCSQGAGLNYVWNFGDGSQPPDTRATPDHTYSVEGCYDVSISVTDGNGCTATYSEDSALCVSEVNPCIFADDTESVCPEHLACFDTCFNFFNIPIKNILWDFGDGSFSTITNPCHIYVRAGRFPVTVYIELDNFCKDTLTRTSYIFVGGATGNITAEPDTGCVPMDVIFNSNDSGAVSRFWITPWDPFSVGRLDDDTIQTTVYVPGSWRPAVVLTDAQVPEPCSYVLYADFDIWADTVYADFWTEEDTVCREDYVYFRDTSRSLLDTNIVRWEWDFGDGTTDTVQHPRHIFSATGVHDVCLTAYSGIDCYAQICKPIFVRDKPEAIFTVSDTSGCDTLLVNFLDASTPGINSPLDKWYWDFGDTSTIDDTSISQNPTHTYRDTGQYIPYLVVTDADGCDDTATAVINVYKTPDGIYNPDTLQLCRYDTVQLFSDSLYSSYQWTPDTALSNDTIANPLAFPRDTTSYEVFIFEPHGCSKRDTVTINVIPLPPLTVTPYPDTTICYGDTIQLTAVGGTNHQWQGLWLSDNGIPNPLAYPAATVTYTVTNEGVGGCTNSDTVRVIVSNLGANFVGERSCFGDPTDFVDLSSRTDLPIISWNWDFGDLSGTSTLRNPSYTYATADSFLAQLVISDAIGCTDTATQIVIIDTPATAVAGFDTTICFGFSVRLYSSGGAVVFWTPDDGSIDTASVFNPVVTPNSTTVYTANITNGVCPYDQANVTVTVIPPPEISTLEDATLLRGEAIQLVTTVDRYDSIIWSPADSLSCTNCLSPFASPDETITYTINVTDEYGCTNSASVTVEVRVECEEDQIWVANAFAPYSAEFAENRNIKVHLIGLEKMNYFKVYDRWGKLIFETTNESDVWKGTNMDGVELNGGVYVFVCEAVCWYKKVLVKTGNITLIR